MNLYYDEHIGLESMLAIEIIDLLNLNKEKVDEQSMDTKSITMDTPLLDEYELAMAA